MSKEKPEVKIIEISFEEFTDIDFRPPATYFIRSALGSYIFFKTKDRGTAQLACNAVYGAGQYTVIAAKIIKSKGELSVTGTSSRRK